MQTWLFFKNNFLCVLLVLFTNFRVKSGLEAMVPNIKKYFFYKQALELFYEHFLYSDRWIVKIAAL